MSIQTFQIYETSSSRSQRNKQLDGSIVLLFEDFKDEFSWPDNPPFYEELGSLGEWTLNCTDMASTWYHDTTNPKPPSSPAVATVTRGIVNSVPKYDWLITPRLDFTGRTEIKLEFYWWGEYHTSVYKNYTDFNVKISIDNGSTWNTIWTEEDHVDFDTWEWYHEVIDLSGYNIYSEVKIGFQFYSKSTTQGFVQLFSIDEILVHSPNPIELKCDCGGPYEWWWETQRDYDPEGVRFHGSVEPFGLRYNWFWDFGDGNTSNTSFNPWNFYGEVGNYTVKLRVIDNTTTPSRVARSSTNVTVFLLPPPKFEIDITPVAFGRIIATIKNTAEYNATNVVWNMSVDWGLRQLLGRDVGAGNFSRIPSGITQIVRSKLVLLVFGPVHITITVKTENLIDTVEHIKAFKIGPLILKWSLKT